MIARACKAPLLVSIHAPARGATEDGIPKRSAKEVSIHAPARGATSLDSFVRIAVMRFNSRSREGSDGS